MIEEPKTKHSPEIARIVRLEFERLAMKMERQKSNKLYETFFRRGARMIRDAKPD